MVNNKNCIYFSLIIFVVLSVLYISNYSYSLTNNELIRIESEQYNSDSNAWRQLTVQDIEETFESTSLGRDVAPLLRILGMTSTTISDEDIYYNNYEEAQLYISLVNKLKECLNNKNREFIINLESAMGEEYNNCLNIMDQVSSRAAQVPQSDNDEDRETTGTADMDIDDFDWDEISPETYAGQGISDFEDVQKLWNKIKDVDYYSLSNEDKVKYRERITNLGRLVTTIFSANIDAGSIGGAINQIIDSLTSPIYTNPLTTGQTNQNAENVTPDSIIGDAEIFINDGQNTNIATINQNSADTVLNSIYNIMLAIGITVTVIWGLVIAIKLMMSSVEEKAEYKKMLWSYLIGCIVIFGSFVIWKIVIIVMNNVL